MTLPYRVPCPPEPDGPEEEEPYAAVLRGQQRRARIATGLAACFVATLAAAGLARPPPPRAETATAAREEARRARAREALAAAVSAAAEAQGAFESAVRDAVRADVVPRPELGACPVAIAAPSGLTRAHSFPLLVLERHEIETGSLPSQAIADLLADVRRAEAHLAAGRYEEAALYAEALQHPGRLSFEVVLAASATKKPSATSESAYVAGSVAGRAYLYDFASRSILCAADVEAKSSSAIGYAYAVGSDAPVGRGAAESLAQAVELDMRTQIERAIASEMKLRAAPRVR